MSMNNDHVKRSSSACGKRHGRRICALSGFLFAAPEAIWGITGEVGPGGKRVGWCPTGLAGVGGVWEGGGSSTTVLWMYLAILDSPFRSE